MEWKQYFRSIAHQIKLKSKDQNTKIGAVIVGSDNQIVSTGYNSFPRGINDELEHRQKRPEKYYFFEHAERNAIYNAALIGVSTKGTTMYLTCGIPCADCARAIINAGIQSVICEPEDSATYESGKDDIWKEHAKRSLEMFNEANVRISYY